LRVLVTRPKLSAARTAERLISMGHEPVLLPLSKAVHHPQAAAEALRSPHAALAVTSAEALRAIAAPEIRSVLDLGKPLFAVGEATAAVARSAGFGGVHAGAGDGEDLADLITGSHVDISDGILYLAGRPRARGLEERLEALGVPVRIAEIYEMAAVEYQAADLAGILLTSRPDAVLLYSRENAQRFFDLAAPYAGALADMRICCMSDRTAARVPAEYRHHVRVAAAPSEEALLTLL
jgi:uroporphyrinogen-III synthase